MDQQPASEALMLLISCGYKTNCATKRYCVSQGLLCTDSCRCCDLCQNTNQREYPSERDNESDMRKRIKMGNHSSWKLIVGFEVLEHKKNNAKYPPFCQIYRITPIRLV